MLAVAILGPEPQTGEEEGIQQTDTAPAGAESSVRGRSVSVATGMARLAVTSPAQPAGSTLPPSAILVAASGEGASAPTVGDLRDDAGSGSLNLPTGRHDVSGHG